MLLLFIIAAAALVPSPTLRQDWPNMLANAWLFDSGSNFGYSLRQQGKGYVIIGPAPDWALGDRDIPVLEIDALVTTMRKDLNNHRAFAAVECRQSTLSQQWILTPGTVPGSSTGTNIKGATTGDGCWEIEACATGQGAAVNCNWGCKSIPKSCASACDCNGAWSSNANGTITSVMDGQCLTVSNGKGSIVNVQACTGKSNQKFSFKPVPSSTTSSSKKNKNKGVYTITQGSLCIDNDAPKPGPGRLIHQACSLLLLLFLFCCYYSCCCSWCSYPCMTSLYKARPHRPHLPLPPPYTPLPHQTL